MSKLEKTLKLIKEALPEAENVYKLSKEDQLLNDRLLKLNDRRKQSNSVPLTKEQLIQYEKNLTMPVDPLVGNKPSIPKQEGPATLSETGNKTFDTDLSGQVDYMRKKKGTVAAMAPLGAAGELFDAAQQSPLGDLATKWDKIKGMVGDKLAKQLDLSGGKDKEFQQNASDALSTVADPVNLIPGAGGVAASALEMLAREKAKKRP